MYQWRAKAIITESLDTKNVSMDSKGPNDCITGYYRMYQWRAKAQMTASLDTIECINGEQRP